MADELASISAISVAPDGPLIASMKTSYLSCGVASWQSARAKLSTCAAEGRGAARQQQQRAS